ncbi:MAG: ABC transporter permease [Fulvivirga sp.]
MLRNYIKIAFRNLIKERLYSFINIFGLGFGMACVLLIAIFVRDELSYDKFHKDAGNIYRIAWWSQQPQTRTPHPMALAMVKDFPQVVSGTSLSPLWGPGLTRQTFSVKNLEKDLTFDERGILSVDSTFFDVFSFELVKGNRDKVLREPMRILLSETSAKKYFGDEEPIGKQLAINDDTTLLVVEGVFKDVPKNSHFHFDALVSYVTMKIGQEEDAYYTWADFGHFNYIRLLPGSDPQELQDQLLDWLTGYVEFSEEDRQRLADENMHFKLQPITDIHLHSQIRWELEPNGNIDYVYIMSAAALLILVIACVNFMNLTTARSTDRSKEIGIRKTLGAFKFQVTSQFLGESIMTAVAGMVLAGFIAEISLPFFNQVTGKALDISYVQNPGLILLLLGAGVVTGLASGLYPAFFLSSVHPVLSLKGIDKIKPKGATFRKVLIVFQFTISMLLIAGSIIIYNQLNFINNRDLGFDKEQVMVLPLKNYELIGSFDAIRNELTRIPGVESVSAASNIPGRQFNQNPIFKTDDPQNQVGSSEAFVDADIINVLGLELAEGRGFLKNNPADSAAFVINETAAKNLGLEPPYVGSEITWDWDNGDLPPARGTVIGVVKDFNYSSLHNPVRPLLLSLRPAYNHIIVKLSGKDLPNTIAEVENVWQQFENRFEFEYSFLSTDLENQYIGEKKTAQVFSAFSFIAVIIACFGLFGIASISYAQRLKEVSIRKVFGASTGKLLRLLVADFVKLIGIAILIGTPFTWFIMDNWLQNFNYRIVLAPANFLISAMALIVVALITVAYLTFRTTSQNPVDNLKEQ